jgi:hypothetical protein
VVAGEAALMSETSRIARALVASRGESFASRRPRDDSEARVAAALANIVPKRLAFERRWRDDPGGLTLDATYRPAPGTRRFLQATSLVLLALIASSVWAVMAASEEGALAFLVPLMTVLAILAFPFVVVAMGSQREAEEAAIARAIKRALTDEDESGAGRSR